MFNRRNFSFWKWREDFKHGYWSHSTLVSLRALWPVQRNTSLCVFHLVAFEENLWQGKKPQPVIKQRSLKWLQTPNGNNSRVHEDCLTQYRHWWRNSFTVTGYGTVLVLDKLFFSRDVLLFIHECTAITNLCLLQEQAVTAITTAATQQIIT